MRSNILDNADVKEIGQCLATEEYGWCLWYRVDIGLSPTNRETIQTNKPLKYYTKTRGQNISSSLEKNNEYTQWVTWIQGSKVDKRRLTSLDLNVKEYGKSRRRMASERQINRLLGLLAVKIGRTLRFSDKFAYFYIW